MDELDLDGVGVGDDDALDPLDDEEEEGEKIPGAGDDDDDLLGEELE